MGSPLQEHVWGKIGEFQGAHSKVTGEMWLLLTGSTALVPEHAVVAGHSSYKYIALVCLGNKYVASGEELTAEC